MVNLTSFRILPNEGITPRFKIGLNIVNPNSGTPHLKGTYYTVDVEDHRVLAGVTDTLPAVESYSEANIILEAGIDLLSEINLFRSHLQQPKYSFSYSFNAKFDSSEFTPHIHILDEAEISLNS